MKDIVTFDEFSGNSGDSTLSFRLGTNSFTGSECFHRDLALMGITMDNTGSRRSPAYRQHTTLSAGTFKSSVSSVESPSECTYPRIDYRKSSFVCNQDTIDIEPYYSPFPLSYSCDPDAGQLNNSRLQSNTMGKTFSRPKFRSQTLPLCHTSALILFIPKEWTLMSVKACSIHPVRYPIPKEIPPEIEALVAAHRHGMPVSVIVSRNSPLLPCNLPQEYGCCFLGFFFVTDIKASKQYAPLEYHD